MTTNRFTIDRAGLVVAMADSDPPYIGGEHPGRDIAEIVYDYSNEIGGPLGNAIRLYPQTCDGDPDMLLVVVTREAGAPNLAYQYAMEWTSIASRDDIGRDLDTESVVRILDWVVFYANEILDDHDTELARVANERQET